MDKKGRGGGGHAGQPAAQLGAIGVSGKGIYLPYGCLYWNVTAVDAEGFGTVKELAAASSLGLKASHQHGVFCLGQAAGQMVEDPAAVHHPT